ncbi:MAG: ankyrin repeat domain-containing protein [Phycisphaerales bacterium]
MIVARASRRASIARPPALLTTIAVLMLAAGLILFYVIGSPGGPPQPSGTDRAVAPMTNDTGPSTKGPSKIEETAAKLVPPAAVFAAIASRDASALRTALAAKPDLSQAATDGAMKGLAPLAAATRTGDAALVGAILAAGASVDQTGAEERTALHEAAAIGSAAAVEAILKANAAVDARDAAGRTALMLAVAGGHEAAVAALLAGGVSVNVADDKGVTAVALAADGSASISLLDRLIQAKGDPAAADKAGQTPLMRAAARGNADKVIALLNAGALASTKAADGKTARDLALARGDDAGRACAAVLEQAVP